jgi:hypothetical protein
MIAEWYLHIWQKSDLNDFRKKGATWPIAGLEKVRLAHYCKLSLLFVSAHSGLPSERNKKGYPVRSPVYASLITFTANAKPSMKRTGLPWIRPTIHLRRCGYVENDYTLIPRSLLRGKRA